MTLREKLGQLIMFGFPGLTPGPEALRLIEEYKAGNIVLFAHNLESAAQTRRLCEELRRRVQRRIRVVFHSAKLSVHQL